MTKKKKSHRFQAELDRDPKLLFSFYRGSVLNRILDWVVVIVLLFGILR